MNFVCVSTAVWIWVDVTSVNPVIPSVAVEVGVVVITVVTVLVDTGIARQLQACSRISGDLDESCLWRSWSQL
jgi:hypothetical protein